MPRLACFAALLLAAPLLGCPPVRDGAANDDDATSPGEPTVEERYEDLDVGECAAGWSLDPAAQEPPLPGEGGTGTATYGLWHSLDCRVMAPNGLLTLTLDSFDPAPDTDVGVQRITIDDADDEPDSRDASLGDAGFVHFADGSYESVGGWWEGDAEHRQDDGGSISLQWQVFRDLRLDAVVGR